MSPLTRFHAVRSGRHEILAFYTTAEPDADHRAQAELFESGGGRPGLPSLINLRFLWTFWAPVPNKPTVSVDVLGSRP